MAKSRARFLAELLGTDGLVKKAKSALAGADEVIDLSALPSIPNSKLTNSSITINSSATSLGGSVTLTTANVAENTNLYYTDARADARIAAADTGDLSEGSNLYYTDARADARVNLQTGSNLNLSSKNTADLAEGTNLYYTNARADARIAAASTSDLSEGSNLYYTDARADARVALIVDSAPGTLNTLNELAAALGDDANFSTTVTNSIAAKLPLAGGTLTGNLSIGGATPQGNLTIKGAASDDIDLLTFSEDGTNQSFSFNGNFAGSGSTGNNLTLDSYWTNDIMAWTGDGNVGIGDSTPTFKLDVAGTGRYTADLYAENDVYIGGKLRHNGDVDNYLGFGTDIQSFVTGNSTRAQFSNTLVRFNQEGLNQDFQIFGENDDNLFYADASTDRIGIGTNAPGVPLHVKKTGSTSAVQEFLRFENHALGGAGAGSSINFHHYHAGGGPTGGAKAASITAQNMATWPAGTPSSYSSGLTFGTLHENTFAERMRLDSAGTLFLGTTSPTVHSSATGIVFDNGSLLNGITRGANNALTLAQNLSVDSGNTWMYLATDEGSYYQQYGGNHYFGTTPSGTAGSDATVTSKLTILNGGNVGIGTDAPYGLTHWKKSSTVNLVATNTGADGQADTTVMSLIGQARGYSNNLSKLASIDFKTDPTTWYYGAITFNVANLDGTDTSRTPLEAMRINRLGNVGIGTDSPDSRLDVEADEDTWISRIYNTGSDANAQALLVRSDATAAHDAPVMGVYADGGYKMLVKSTGNVGIGTTAPTEKLVVNGSLNSSNQSANFSTGPYRAIVDIINSSKIARVGTVAGTNTPTGTQGEVSLLVNSNEKVRIKASGNVGIGTDDPSARLHVYTTGYPSGKFERYGTSTATRGWTQIGHSALGYSGGTGADSYLVSQNGFGFAVNEGTTALVITDGGKVGIGTSSPTAPLQLNTAGNTADGTYYSTFTINNTGSSTWSRLRFDRGGVAKWGIALGTDDKFKISNLYTGGSVATPDDNVLVIDNNSNVGIGTVNPTSKLDLVGDLTVDAAIHKKGEYQSTYSATYNGSEYIARGLSGIRLHTYTDYVTSWNPSTEIKNIFEVSHDSVNWADKYIMIEIFHTLYSGGGYARYYWNSQYNTNSLIEIEKNGANSGVTAAVSALTTVSGNIKKSIFSLTLGYYMHAHVRVTSNMTASTSITASNQLRFLS